MLFTSYSFIFLFLPITFILYIVFLKKKLYKVSKAVLLMGSLIFCSFISIKNGIYLICSILLNHAVYVLMTKFVSHKKQLLTIGILINIILLCVLKYNVFVTDGLNSLFNLSIRQLNLFFPLGISFYTFSNIYFLYQSYKAGDEFNKVSLFDFALYISFFPKFVEGPITSPRKLLDQFNNVDSDVIDFEKISKSIVLFSVGIFKKVIFAEYFASVSDRGFSDIGSLTTLTAVLTAVAYAFQIYFDFSGYSDMAISVALLFGFDIPINLNPNLHSIAVIDN